MKSATQSKDSPRPLPCFPPMLRIGEAAEALAVTERTLRGWIAARKVPVVRLSARCVRILAEDLAEFIERRRVGA